MFESGTCCGRVPSNVAVRRLTCHPGGCDLRHVPSQRTCPPRALQRWYVMEEMDAGQTERHCNGTTSPRTRTVLLQVDSLGPGWYGRTLSRYIVCAASHADPPMYVESELSPHDNRVSCFFSFTRRSRSGSRNQQVTLIQGVASSSHDRCHGQYQLFSVSAPLARTRSEQPRSPRVCRGDDVLRRWTSLRTEASQ